MENKQRNKNANDTMQDAYRQLLSIFNKTKAEEQKADAKIDHAMVCVLQYLKANVVAVPEELQDQQERMLYMLRPTGVMHREVELSGQWWKQTTGPLLGKTQQGDMVALLPAFPSGYAYVDAQTGQLVRINRKTDANIQRQAISFYKSLPLRPLKLFDLLQFLVQSVSRGDILWIVLSSLLVAALGLVTPYLNKLIFDSVIPSGMKSNILPVAGLLFGATISGLLFGISKKLILARVNDKIHFSAECAAMARVFSLPAVFFKQHAVGDLSHRINSVAELVKTVSDVVLTTGLATLFSLAYLVQMSVFAQELVFPALMVTLATFGCIVLVAMLQVRQSAKRVKLATQLNGLLYALFGGMQKIKLAGAEERAFAKWAQLYSEEGKLRYNPPFILKISNAVYAAITLGGTIWFYAVAAKAGTSQSSFVAFTAAFGMVSGAFLTLGTSVEQIAFIKPLYKMLQPILEAQPELGENKRQVLDLKGEIELTEVGFRYAEDLPWVIQNFSLHIKPGEYVGIVGKSGCGKSTLMRLLIGFEKPQMGAIYYDGEDLSELDVRSLRQRVGVSLQNGKLLAGDIFSNITVTSPWCTMEEAWEAARMAGIEDDIRNMPMGMMTMVSEGGGGVSGGQKQRLLIARALAAKPKILMFDEATSALDNVVQKAVVENLATLECSRIVIAHRLSTVKSCDKVIFMEDGNIAEQGSYDELMALRGRFYEFAMRQM